MFQRANAAHAGSTALPPCIGPVVPTKNIRAKECSSIGQSTGLQNRGLGFESLLSCQLNQRFTAKNGRSGGQIGLVK